MVKGQPIGDPVPVETWERMFAELGPDVDRAEAVMFLREPIAMWRVLAAKEQLVIPTAALRDELASIGELADLLHDKLVAVRDHFHVVSLKVDEPDVWNRSFGDDQLNALHSTAKVSRDLAENTDVRRGPKGEYVRNLVWTLAANMYEALSGRPTGVSRGMGTEPNGPFVRFLLALSEAAFPGCRHDPEAIAAFCRRRARANDNAATV
jgi:hypothetical protein